MSHKILRLPQVKEATGLARSTIYKNMNEGIFPKSISLGAKSIGWLEADIQQWIEEKRFHSSSKNSRYLYGN